MTFVPKDNSHKLTMEALMQEYLALDNQCVEHAGTVAYSELTKRRTEAALAIVNNYRFMMHSYIKGGK